MKYAGFWRRLFATLIDGLILHLPLGAITYFLSQLSRHYQLYTFIPFLMIYFWYNVALVSRHGGTPGKLILNLEIKQDDGSSIGSLAAFMRYSVDFLFIILTLVSVALLWQGVSDEQFNSLSPSEKGILLNEYGPYHLISYMALAWGASEFLALLLNERKKALHDYLAGTVVVIRG